MGQDQKTGKPAEPTYNFRGIKISKCWITRKETASFTIDGQTSYFESSIGIGVESDNPEHNSRIIYEAAHRSLNILFERERLNWLSAKIAAAERKRVKDELAALEPVVPTSAPVSESVPAVIDENITPEEESAESSQPVETDETPEHLRGDGAF